MPILAVPSKFEHFQVLEYVASGLCGETYRARDAFGNFVALKICTNRDSTVWSYFINEELILRKIAQYRNHPHIISYVASNLSKQPPYIVTRFITGQRLDQIVNNKPQEATFVIRVIGQIASALDYLHYGHPDLSPIVHRDVKPNNILVDQHGNAVLIDFGIASHSGFAVAREQILGTPAYMSPEQYKIGAECPASDQFSLALVAFYMLTGKQLLPNAKDQAMRTIAEIKLQRLHKILKNNQYTTEVLMKALSIQPDERYKDCMTFANELQNALIKDCKDVNIPILRSSMYDIEINGKRIPSLEWIIIGFIIMIAIIMLIIGLVGWR